MFGRELAADPDLGPIERLYIRLLGAPVQGLRVRARWLLPRVPPGVRRILDAGCGRAAFVLHLARTRPAARVVGVDCDADRLRRAAVAARTLGLARASFVRADLARLPFRRGAFDLALSVDVIEDAEDPTPLLRELRATLADGGCLLGHTPARTRRWWVLSWRENFDAPGHARPGFEREELASHLAVSGWRDARTRFTYGVLETLANNLSYAITGARERNRALYALVFPFLLLLTWLGRREDPDRGAGLLFEARA